MAYKGVGFMVGLRSLGFEGVTLGCVIWQEVLHKLTILTWFLKPVNDTFCFRKLSSVAEGVWIAKDNINL